MKNLTSKMQDGIGLIEVLITTVVVALGLLAVASLQGDFIKSSGDNKIRAEALVLAEKKVEALRNNINIAGYDAIDNSSDTVADPDNPIAGINASFNRSWVIDASGTTDRKNISVWVSWGNDADERVNVVTEMAFIDPGKSALYSGESAGGSTGAVPSPRQNASEDVSAASEGVVGTDLAITDLITGSGAAGVDQQLQVDPETGTNLILSQVAAGSHFYTATHSDYSAKIEPGVIAVFLCDDSLGSNGTCSHIQNHFGGVVHRIKGKVFSTSTQGLTNILVGWTSSEVHSCYIGEITTGSLAYMPYECVYAGNCNATASGTRTASSGGLPDAVDEGCFEDSVVSDSQINERSVGPGGEYGDVGLLGLDYQGGNTEQVCFLEDTTDPSTSILLNTSGNEVLNENYLFAVTKRLYSTRRVKRNGSINDHKQEGINRSYTNHNFFIINRGSGGTAKSKCNTEVTTNAEQVAPREIARALNEGTANAVTVYEKSYTGGVGTASTLTGNVTSSATKLGLFIPEIGTCYLNNALDRTVDATGYACVVASDVTSTEIIGSSNQHKNSSPSVFASCTKTVDGNPGCHWLTDFTGSYNDGSGVSSCTTPWGAELANGDTVPAYSTSNTCSTSYDLVCTDGVLVGEASAIYQTDALCSAGLAMASCSSPWFGGPNLEHNVAVDAYSVASVPYGGGDGVCSDFVVSISCNNGTLTDGSSDITAGSMFQSCTISAPCIVPDIVGEGTGNDSKIADVEAKITDEGLIANGTGTTGTPAKVNSQDPAAGTPVACGSTVTFEYYQ